jgi:hypothetical protein
MAACRRASFVFVTLLAGCGAPEATCDRWLAGGKCAVIEDAGVFDAAVPIDAATVPVPDFSTAPDLAEPPWMPLQSGTNEFLTDVWGSGAGDVWAVGGNVVLRSKDHGQSWIPVDVGPGSTFTSIWGDGAGTIVIAEGAQMLTVRRSEDGGATWALVSTNQLGVNRIRCHASECFGVGEKILHSTDAAKTWTDVSPKDSDYRAAWIDASFAWIGINFPPGLTMLRSYDHGATWTDVDEPSMHGVQDLWGVGNTLFAVAPITILRSDDHGATWFPQLVPPWNDLNGNLWCVWGSSASDIYVGGSQAILHASDGVTFRLVWNQVEDIEGIWGSGPDDVYAVGDKGLILHRVGP